MIIKNVIDVTTGYYMIVLIHNEDQPCYIINPKNFPKTNKFNYAFVLTPGVMDDCFYLKNFKDCVDTEVNIDSVEGFKAKLNGVFGYMLGTDSAFFKKIYDELLIRKNCQALPESDAVLSDFMELVSGLYSVDEYIKNDLKIIKDDKENDKGDGKA